MIKRIIKIFVMFALVVGTYNVISNAAILATSKTVNSGDTVSIVVTSNVQVSAYTVTVTGHNGLTFVTSSGGSGAGTKSISDAKATGGMSTLATFQFKAPVVEKDQTFQVSFSATGMGDVNLNSIENSTCAANVIVKAKSQNTNNQENNTNSNNDSTGTTEKKEEKSNNANLSNLGIRPNDFSGFKAETTSYDVSVPEDVEEVEVYATAQHSKATVSGTGKKKLEIGQNTLSVVVTAEDGTKKTYTMNVTRGGATEEEPIEEFTEANGLSELNIEGLDLSPEFAADIYEYTAKYVGEDTKLHITTVATNASYVVEIVGNEELKEGENVVTILVSDKEGNNIATYQIIVDKSLVSEEALQEEQAKAEEEKRNKIIIGCSIAAVIVLLIIIILIVRHRKNAYYDDEWGKEEDHNDIFTRVNEEEDESQIDNGIEEIEEPKSIRKSRMKEIEQKTGVEEDKETLRQKFLDNYNSNNYDDYEEVEEKTRRRKQKGKRFK